MLALNILHKFTTCIQKWNCVRRESRPLQILSASFQNCTVKLKVIS